MLLERHGVYGRVGESLRVEAGKASGQGAEVQAWMRINLKDGALEGDFDGWPSWMIPDMDEMGRLVVSEEARLYMDAYGRVFYVTED